MSPSSDGIGVIRIDGDVARPYVAGSRTGIVGDFLAEAAPSEAADHATVHSGDDGYMASIPLTELVRGELTDGRLIVPDGRTLCWNVKNVVRIEVTAGKQPDSVPANPPH